MNQLKEKEFRNIPDRFERAIKLVLQKCLISEGIAPHIDPVTGNWMIGDADTGTKAKGSDGVSPHIDPETKHWMIGDTDTGCIAEGTGGGSINPDDLANYYTKDEITELIQAAIDNFTLSQDILDTLKGTDGITPHIDPATKRWMIGDVDTGQSAEGISDIEIGSITIAEL